MSPNNGWTKTQSTNTGSSWGTTALQIAGPRLGYADGSYEGLPVSNGANSADIANGVNESGIKCTTPPNAVLQVRGLAFFLASNSSPTADLAFKLYNNQSLLGTTNSIPKGNIGSTAQWYEAYFTNTISIQPGTILRLTMNDMKGSSDGSNGYKCFEFTGDPDSNSQTLVPMEGTWQKTFGGGSSWTDTAGTYFGAALLLDSDGEFNPGGSFIPGVVSARPYPGLFQ
jgi:hypothetical protein